MVDTIAALLDRAASRHGVAPFLLFGEQRIAFDEFVRRVGSAARALQQQGLEPGARCAVLMPRGPDVAVVLLAVMLAGGVAVPIHARLKRDQVAHVLADCEPALVVTASERTVALVDAPSLLAGHRVLDADRDVLDGSHTAKPHTTDAASPPAAARSATARPGDAAVMLYTSGSTGAAKGIVQTHENLTAGARIVSDYLGLTPEDHLLALLSFSFDYGLNQLLSALYAGCRLTTAEHLGVGELASLLARHRPTGLAGVPSLWHECAVGLADGTLGDDHGRSLRFVTNSGGALRREDSAVLRARWPHTQVFAMYGLTEAFRSAFLPPAEFDAHPESFGYAIEGVELLLVDVGSCDVVPGPGVGELVHAGALVAAGYWRRDEAQRERFRPDPRGLPGTVVYSGDLVRRDGDGRHFFVSRLDRMLKVQGHRVSPDEVAQPVREMPELAGDGPVEVVVFGVDGGAEGHRIVLCCVGDPADQALRTAIRRRCRARLPSYMQPAHVLVVPRMPLNANGKVDEAALRAMMASCRDAAT